MKVLYIGHFSENSGWANSAMNNVKALLSIDIEVVCRNIKLTNKSGEISEQIIECMKKDTENVTHCIQHVLPHHYVGTNKYQKNIGYLEFETESIDNTNWCEYLKLMDEIWVPNSYLSENINRELFQEIDVSTIPHACNITKYGKLYQDIKLGDIDHTFKFYTICDLSDRKNIESLITCFHCEFDPSEPVSLILKIKKEGADQQEVQNYLKNLCEKVKKRSRIYADPSMYHQELILLEDFSSDQIMSLHQTCDCYVSTSHGEAWSLPAFDAMAMGNSPICIDQGGPQYFLEKQKKQCGATVEFVEKICRSTDQAFPDLFTGKDYWYEPNEKQICYYMRYYYNRFCANDKEFSKENKKTEGILNAKNYSYLSLGKIMEVKLNG